MSSAQRPLAVVMVADATPMVLTNLRQLATWADLVLTEADATTSGEPREPLRDRWRELLGLGRPELSIVTTQLAGDDKWQRQRVQRDSVLPLLVRQPPGRAVLMLDSDEFLDAPAVQEAIAGLGEWDEPRRLGLVPLYGAVDRVARSIHCCWHEPLAGLRDPTAAAASRYVVAAPSVARAEQMLGRSPSRVRFRSKLLTGTRTFGVHITMAEGSAALTARKLINTRHTWDDRVLRAQHLDTMLPSRHLSALRSWAEARLDPRVPDVVVAAVDDYVATRDPNADDFLLPLNDYLMTRMPTHIGQPVDPAEYEEETSAQ